MVDKKNVIWKTAFWSRAAFRLLGRQFNEILLSQHKTRNPYGDLIVEKSHIGRSKFEMEKKSKD